MKNGLVFCGYSNFDSKDGIKHFYVLNFFTYPIIADDRALCEKVDLFVDSNKYNEFIKAHKLLDIVEVPFEIVGNRVRYYL